MKNRGQARRPISVAKTRVDTNRLLTETSLYNNLPGVLRSNFRLTTSLCINIKPLTRDGDIEDKTDYQNPDLRVIDTLQQRILSSGSTPEAGLWMAPYSNQLRSLVNYIKLMYSSMKQESASFVEQAGFSKICSNSFRFKLISAPFLESVTLPFTQLRARIALTTKD